MKIIQKIKTISWKSILLTTLALLLCVGIGVGLESGNKLTFANGYDKSDAPETIGLNYVQDYDDELRVKEEGSIISNQQMLIIHHSMNLIVKNNDEIAKQLREYVKSIGGYIETSSSRQTQETFYTYNFTIRVPSDQYEAFIEYLIKLGKVVHSNESMADVYKEYQNNHLRLQSLYKKLDRLYELLEDAKDMGDLIVLEDSISTTMYEIERMEANQQQIHDQVAYSTIQLILQPDIPHTIQTGLTGNSLLDSFIQGINSFIYVMSTLLRGIIFISPFAVVLFIGYKVVSIRKKKKQVKEKMIPSNQESSQ